MTTFTIQQALELAVERHGAGHLAEAEQIYRQILAQQPNHADALHLLGVVAHQLGRQDVAIELIGRSIALNPNRSDAWNNQGEALRSLGRMDDAVAAYRKAIVLRPDHAEVHSNLANVLRITGHLEEAIAECQKAIALKPSMPAAHNNLGNALRSAGKADEAIAACRRAIELKPDFAEAHGALANALYDKGQLDEAIASYRTAAAFQPDNAEVWSNLGTALRDIGNPDEALVACRRAIVLSPAYAEAHNNLGNAFGDKGQADEAIAAYRTAVRLKPGYAEAFYNLALELNEKRLFEEAIAAYRHSIVLRPGYADACYNLGVLLYRQGELDEAIATYRQATAVKPDFPEAFSNLGNALSERGLLNEAIAACRRAIELQADFAVAHHNIALMYLLRGDFAQGWEEFEWRWRTKEFVSPRWNFSRPQWDGAELADQTILLHAEQGFGDTIQFSRYIPRVAARCRHLIVLCPPPLHRLLQCIPGAEWKVLGEPPPPFDVHCPLMSLPRAFGTTTETIPNGVPYLKADADAVEQWRKRLGEYAQMTVETGVGVSACGSTGVGAPGGTHTDTLTQPHSVTRRSAASSASRQHPFKIGLAWSGVASHVHDRRRSTQLSTLAPLADVPGVSFFSLQVGEASAQAKHPPAGMSLIDWTMDLNDFAETAALIVNLDLVISVDTAVAHLAGALAKPVWILLPFVPDWRWLLGREDTPWYPTMRLFRQPSIGDWDGMVRNVADSLAVLSAGSAPRIILSGDKNSSQ